MTRRSWLLTVSFIGICAHAAAAPAPLADTVQAAKKDGLLVRLKPHVRFDLGAGVTRETISDTVQLITFTGPTAAYSSTRQRLLAHPAVLDIERNVRFVMSHADAPSNGSLTTARRTNQVLPSANAIRVGIIDSGIDLSHPQLSDLIARGINLLHIPDAPYDGDNEDIDRDEMDYNGHGTLVAGLIAAHADPVGVAGVNDHVRLYALKVFDRNGIGYLSDVLRAIAWARAHHLQVLNMSFGSDSPSHLLADAVAAAQADGMVLVAAAGNDAAPMVTYPAAYPGVLAIGAFAGATLSPVSNWGSRIDLYAPGQQLLSTASSAVQARPFAPISGTSAAAALVTGWVTRLLESQQDAGNLRDALLAHTSARNTVHGPKPLLNQATMAADLAQSVVDTLTVWPEPIARFATPGSTLNIQYTVQNAGNVLRPATPLSVRLQIGTQTQVLVLPNIAPLAPQEKVTGNARIRLPDSNAAFTDVALTWVTQPCAQPAHERTLHVTLTREAVVQARATQVWLTPLSGETSAASRTAHVRVRNDGNRPTPQLTCRVAIAAGTGAAVALANPQELGAITIEPLAVGEEREVTVQTTASMPARCTVTADVSAGTTVYPGATQTYDLAPGGQMRLSYAQVAHMASVAAAVQLLEDNNVFLTDISGPDAMYMGAPELRYDWGNAAQIGIGRHGWKWQRDWDLYPPMAKTLIDGANACDGIDVAYGDTGIATWNTHFWIVDEHDHAGLGSHSALDKVYALLLGGNKSGIQDGAIAAYKSGDKAKGWWLLGHAVHLLGDVSTGAHTINRNIHGVVGDAYHDWMDEHHLGWPASVAAQSGSFIDPASYGLKDVSQKLRFLMYTTAQVGAAFPWHSTGVIPSIGFPRSGNGDRKLGGDAPHYDGYMLPIFARIPKHPLTSRDIDADEVLDKNQRCQAVGRVGKREQRADCWDGGDGHVDFNNLSGGGNDLDGDLSAIADTAYVYAVRAIAGLIYVFAQETGQLP